MVHLGLFVEGQPNAVSAQVANDAETIGMGVLSNGLADVAHETPGLRRSLPDFEAFLGHANQFGLLGSGLAEDEHTRGIAVVAVEDGRNVHIDDVALFKDFVVRGDAVANHLVDARADALGETFVVQRSGDGTVVGGVLIDQAVDFGR